MSISKFSLASRIRFSGYSPRRCMQPSLGSKRAGPAPKPPSWTLKLHCADVLAKAVDVMSEFVSEATFRATWDFLSCETVDITGVMLLELKLFARSAFQVLHSYVSLFQKQIAEILPSSAPTHFHPRPGVIIVLPRKAIAVLPTATHPADQLLTDALLETHAARPPLS